MVIRALGKIQGSSSFTDKMALKERSGKNEGASRVNFSGKSILDMINSRCKGPVVKACLSRSRKVSVTQHTKPVGK